MEYIIKKLIKMLEGVNVAKKSCRCKMCNREIKKGEVRGWKFDSKFGIYGAKNYFCKECAMAMAKDDIIEQKKFLKLLEAKEVKSVDIEQMTPELIEINNIIALACADEGIKREFLEAVLENFDDDLYLHYETVFKDMNRLRPYY